MLQDKYASFLCRRQPGSHMRTMLCQTFRAKHSVHRSLSMHEVNEVKVARIYDLHATPPNDAPQNDNLAYCIMHPA